MPGPISQSYDGPDDNVALPRWAFPHLTDAEYEAMVIETLPGDKSPPTVRVDPPFVPATVTRRDQVFVDEAP